MPDSCKNMQSTLNAYLDAELPSPEVRELESHLGDCETCQSLFEHEEQSHSALRRLLRATPPAPDILRPNLMAALDLADAEPRESQPRPRFSLPALARWFTLPATASLLAAAALLLFVWSDLAGQNQSSAASLRSDKNGQVTRDVARQHLQGTPLFVSDDRNTIARGATRFLNAPVRAPRFALPKVKLLGWTPAQVDGKQSATFIYEIRNQSGRHQVHARAVALTSIDLRSQKKIRINDTDFWVDSNAGFNTLTFLGRGQLAYVFSSDMALDALVSMVVRADVVNTIGE